MTKSPFDNEPDEELGRLLRAELTGSAPEAFLARLRLAVAGAEPGGSQWEVLASWLRPRVMAAAIAAALLLWFGSWLAGSPADTGTMVAQFPAHTVLSPQPPQVDEIMSALMERR
jgi:hypothetical protein